MNSMKIKKKRIETHLVEREIRIEHNWTEDSISKREKKDKKIRKKEKASTTYHLSNNEQGLKDHDGVLRVRDGRELYVHLRNFFFVNLSPISSTHF